MSDAPAAEPNLNLINLAGNLGKVMSLLNQLNDPAKLAQLEADGKLSLSDVQQLIADAHKASEDLSNAVTDLRALLGV